MEKPSYQPGISCPRCINKTSDAQKARFKERQKQIKCAKAKGQIHIGESKKENKNQMDRNRKIKNNTVSQ